LTGRKECRIRVIVDQVIAAQELVMRDSWTHGRMQASREEIATLLGQAMQNQPPNRTLIDAPHQKQ
jgi:hypothetical protein